MIKFTDSLDAWHTDAFARTLKADIEMLTTDVLPLDKGVTQGGMVDDSQITATVLHVSDDSQSILARVGVFFTEIVGGCSCGDDPQPSNAYCELLVSIDKKSAQAGFEVISE